MSDNNTHEIMRALGSLEANQRSTLTLLERIEKRMDNHGTRLGALEQWRAKVLGMAAAISALVSVGLKFVL